MDIPTDLILAILKAFRKFGEGLENEKLGLYKIAEEIGIPEDNLYGAIEHMVEEQLIIPVGGGVEWYLITADGDLYLRNRDSINVVVAASLIVS